MTSTRERQTAGVGPEGYLRSHVPRAGSMAPDNTAARRELAQLNLPKHKRRHPERSISTVVVLFIAAMLTRSLATNSKIGWPVVGQFFFASDILKGLVVTLELTVGGQLLATVLGFVLAAMRQSQNPVLSRLSWLYINVFRGVPLIVQILAWYNLALAFPYLAIGFPFTPWHVQGSTDKIISPFLAGVLALGLAEAAYMAEIVRAGIVAVPRGQFDAALSIGLTRHAAMRRIVLPQTLRVVVPPTGNQFIGLLKASALVSVIGGNDLLTRTQQIYSVNFYVVALLIVASLWYLILTTLATIGQHYLEQWLDRERVGGDREIAGTETLLDRLRHNLFGKPPSPGTAGGLL